MPVRALVVVLCCCAAATAEEPHFRFTQALRDRGFDDTALEYLAMLEKRTDIKAASRERIPYERAVTRIHMAGATRDSSQRTRLLNQAEKELQGFLKSINPQHTLAGAANAELAGILLGKAETKLIEAADPINKAKIESLRDQARGFIQQARKILTTARSQYEKLFKSFKLHIPADQKAKRAARDLAERNLVLTTFELAKTWYKEAKTHDPASPQGKADLDKAAAEFKDVHDRYRTYIYGLYARLWMGKVYEEQGGLLKALGVYDEILRHPKQPKRTQQMALDRVQSMARHFRLIVLNHPKQKEYARAKAEADAWLEANRKQQGSLVGLGIRWERARSLEQGAKIAEPFSEVFDFIEDAYKRLDVPYRIRREIADEMLRRALEDATEINRYAGPYNAPSRAMLARLRSRLRVAAGEPDSFDVAASLAESLVRDLDSVKRELRAAVGAARDPLNDRRGRITSRLENTLRIAMSLAPREQVETEKLARVRYQYAYALFEQKRHFDAAAVAGFLARHGGSESETTLNAAYLEMSAWSRAFLANSGDFEREKLTQAATLLAKNWPNSEKADSARIQLGRIYHHRGESAEVAKWLKPISKDSSSFGESRVLMGQAHWRQALRDPKGDQFAGHRDNAKAALQEGLKHIAAATPGENELPDEAVTAKLILAQIAISEKDTKTALDLLSDGERPVLAAVDVPEESQRPKSGPASRRFAIGAHQTLLRARIAAGLIDDALQSLRHIEKITQAGDRSDLIAIYDEVGRSLQDEIKKLAENKESARLQTLRESFKKFLDERFAGRSELPYGSLVWMSQTYASLGTGLDHEQALPSDREAAVAFNKRSVETLLHILDRQKQSSGFVPDRELLTIQVLAVRGLRQAKRFDEANTRVLDILKTHPNQLDAQIEAAWNYEAWAKEGGDKAGERYHLATGKGRAGAKAGSIWGWSGIALKIQDMLNTPRIRRDPKEFEIFKDRLYLARYHQFQSGRGFAKTMIGSKRRNGLRKLMGGIEVFAGIHNDLPTGWYTEFDTVYHDIQSEIGIKNPRKLKLAKPVVGDPGDDPDPVRVSKTPGDDRTAPNAAWWHYAVVGVILVVIGFISWRMLASPKRVPARAQQQRRPRGRAGRRR